MDVSRPGPLSLTRGVELLRLLGTDDKTIHDIVDPTKTPIEERSHPGAPPPASTRFTANAGAVRVEVTVTTVDVSVERGAARARSLGDLTVQDGEVDVTRVHSVSIEARLRVQRTQKSQDPLVVDLAGDGIATTGVPGGRRFDLAGDGTARQVSWITGDDALLVADRNGNGRLDGGTELFGDQRGAADGIAELARHDSNHDGRIDAADGVWGSLRLATADGALHRLEDAGITSIDVARTAFGGRTSGGDAIDGAVTVHRSDGSTTTAADVYLRYA
ncbi:MAG: hypothetical protein U0V73_12080 [Acidimicrobiia bacterium]